MESATKQHVADKEMAELVTKAFGEHTRLAHYEALEDGWFNSAYRIVLKDGRETILKISPPQGVRTLRYEKDIMRTEVETMRLVRQNGQVPVPEILYYDHSRELLDGEYFFMEKLAGTPYNKRKDSLSAETRASIESGLGRYTRLINEIKGETFGYYSPSAAKSSSWKDSYTSMLAGLLHDAADAGVELPASDSEIFARITPLLPSLDEVTLPRLVHWDLWDGNVFVDEDNRITGIIDFERALWGDPLMEVYFGEFNDRTAYCEGYGLQLPVSQAEKTRRDLYNLYLYLILVIECEYRHYTDPNHVQWARGLLVKELEALRGSR